MQYSDTKSPDNLMFRNRERSPQRRLLASLVIGALVMGSVGCARVAPYERETLARKDMQLQGNAESKAGEEHATAYREGSSGGSVASGGGCGCN